jgi:hypothetical protein
MTLLTEQEIEDLYYTEIDRRELSFARAIEAKVIEKIKAERPVSVETLTSGGKKINYYYPLPEGD